MPILQMRAQRLKFSERLRLGSQPLRGAGSHPRLAGSSFPSAEWVSALHLHHPTGLILCLWLRPRLGTDPSCMLPGS